MDTRAKELLEQATPLPWHSTVLPKTTTDEYGNPVERIPSVYGRPRDEVYIVNIGRGYPGARLDGVRKEADAALIVYAVNRLPDYEAAVEALDDVFTRLDDHFGEDGPDWLYEWADKARAALARLRDEVPK